ncbi:hypothetical protein K0U83_26525 [bacterium]|nr:hypothetical protein [bacterium]
MGFNSTNRLPYLTTHAGAKRWHDQIKPLRSGARMGCRPLAKRSDTHMQIRENPQGDIECVLYETPVVTFKADDTVVVAPGKWPSSYTGAFIEGLLCGVTVNRTRGMVVLGLERRADSGKFPKFPLKVGMSLTMRRVMNEDHVGRWEVEQAEGVGVWAPNRTKANSVRAKYKEMIAYHKGMVSLLTQEREKINEDDPFEAKRLLLLPKEMVADTLGTRTQQDRRYIGNGQHTEIETTYIDMRMFTDASNKPVWAAYYGGTTDEGRREADERTRKRIATWFEVRDKVLDLMRSDQPEETKHANFLKASIGLMCVASGVRLYTLEMQRDVHRPIELSYSAAADAVTRFLTLAYAEEIMEFKKMKVGHVPTTNYAEMLFDEFKNQGEKA